MAHKNPRQLLLIAVLAGISVLVLISGIVGTFFFGRLMDEQGLGSTLTEIAEQLEGSTPEPPVMLYDEPTPSGEPRLHIGSFLPTHFDEQAFGEITNLSALSPGATYLVQEQTPGIFTVYARHGQHFRALHDFPRAPGHITALSISEDGWFTLGYGDGAAEVWQWAPNLHKPEWFWRKGTPPTGHAVMAIATDPAAHWLAVRTVNDTFQLFTRYPETGYEWESAALWEMHEWDEDERGVVTAFVTAEDGTTAEGTVDGVVRVYYRKDSGDFYASWWKIRPSDDIRITTLALSNRDYLGIGDSYLNLYRYLGDDEDWQFLTSYVWEEQGLVTSIALNDKGDFLWGTSSGALCFHGGGELEYDGTPQWWDWAEAGPIVSVGWEWDRIRAVDGVGRIGFFSEQSDGSWSGNWQEVSDAEMEEAPEHD